MRVNNNTTEASISGTTEMNIDLKCMEAAEMLLDEIKKEKIANPEKAINEALAVLKENGLYALVIYLEANSDKKKVYALISKQISTFGDALFSWNGINLRKKASSLAVDNNMFNLFFAIDIIEQMLIYARFLVKGLPKETPKSDTSQSATTGTEQP